MARLARARETNMVDMGVLVGSIRRFGLEGPPYEVVGPAARGADGRARMLVRLLESGEELDYRVDDLVSDPCED
jgi:hypothetical protein